MLKPTIFIASSSESREVAAAVQANLSRDSFPTVWNQAVFLPTRTALTSLLNEATKSDFGVFIFGADDIVRSRGQQQGAVRDNVLFELGVFIGRLGRDRVFVVVSEQARRNLKEPSDLLGMTPVTYDAAHPNLDAALGPPCREILRAVNIAGQLARPEPKSSDPRKQIVFYSPTLKGNPFYHEILDHLIEVTTAADEPIDVIVRKSVSSIPYHQSNDDIRLIKSYANKDVDNTVLILVPSNPGAYDDILNLPPDLNVNLITIDMEIDETDDRINDCTFLKQTIIVDNECGTQLAASVVLEYWNSTACLDLQGFNFLVCEGEFHNRGEYFAKHLMKVSTEAKLNISRLDVPTQLQFSDAGTARAHVKSVLSARQAELHNRSTMIFCANDNLALGARAALSFAQGSAANDCDIKIVSFDASDVIRTLLKLGDPYLLASVDQMYFKYAQIAVGFATEIFDRRTAALRVTKIKPGIIRNLRLFS